MNLQNAKGTKDYLPQEMIALQQLMDTLRTLFEQYGYNPLSTPVLERMDVLAAKSGGGNEIMKEVFRVSDQGGRDLGLRFDLTVPFARLVGQNPELKMPFKRYQIEKVYRDGPIGPGRYREFWQCDIDVVGAKGMKAEAELLQIVSRFFSEINLPVSIVVNNRKVLQALVTSLTDVDAARVITIIDKSDKISRDALVKELTEAGVTNATELLDAFDGFATGDFAERVNKCKSLLGDNEGLQELQELYKLITDYGVSGFVFDPRLARGLDYYTSSIFEVRCVNNAITSSITAGGRYNKLIGGLLENNQEYPAVGLSFGLSRILDALKAANKLEESSSVSQAFVISFNEDAYALRVAEELRKEGIRVETDIAGRNMKKNLDYCNAKGIPYAIIVGENERAANNVTMKDLSSGEQTVLRIEDAKNCLKK